MARSPRRSRTASNLSQPVLQQLDMYALAASAAGVSLLAWAQPAQAKIVYTPAHIPIIQNGGPVELDLNHDGINDFLLTWVYTTEKRRGPEGFWQSSMSVVPVQQSNRVRISKSKGYSAAAALAKGQNVGERSPFEPGNSAMNMQACVGGTSGGCGGPWLKVKQAYLGLKFVIHGETHFGWAHIRKTGVGITGPTLVGYAYETVPNRRIITGTTKGPDDASVEESNATLTTPPREPATLGLLAMGAGGLSIWRREESVARAIGSSEEKGSLRSSARRLIVSCRSRNDLRRWRICDRCVGGVRSWRNSLRFDNRPMPFLTTL